MGNLEHNIKEAFAAQDANSKMANKEELWSRLATTMHQRKGVAAFWRVAAVFLGLLLGAGVFAGIGNRAKQQASIESLTIERQRLLTAVDSLKLLQLAEKEPVVQVVEKERIVYQEKIVCKNTGKPNTGWEQKYLALSDSIHQYSKTEDNFRQEIENLKKQLAESEQQVLALEKQLAKDEGGQQSAPFELKSERIQLDIQKKPTVKTPEMEMKVFQKSFIENRNNLNKNIFNK
ncbi:hypothetical protein [uncultured Draconibacterium sp.]|uniref:hypothetical protein n=1 Tax=uncultured Draconibacterium sp. TaxID=1573823 RepID=UPI0025E0BA0B|nr:hypothetical protein [uncultured Draconibacterium sp.]